VGHYDDIAPPTNQASLAGRIGRATLRLFEGGHLFIVQDGAAHQDITAHLTDAPRPR